MRVYCSKLLHLCVCIFSSLSVLCVHRSQQGHELVHGDTGVRHRVLHVPAVREPATQTAWRRQRRRRKVCVCVLYCCCSIFLWWEIGIFRVLHVFTKFLGVLSVSFLTFMKIQQ